MARRKVKGKQGSFWGGSPSTVNQISNLTPEQENLQSQLVNAGQEPGAGGAFGTAADYYRDLLSDNPADLQAYTAQQLRQYNEDIVPGLSEQFAGMGSGGLSSSGFRNAQIQGATDLSERLGAMRAQLRQHGAAGLANIGQLGLQPVQSNYQQPGTPGFLEMVAPAIGQAATAYATGGIPIPKAGGPGTGLSNSANATNIGMPMANTQPPGLAQGAVTTSQGNVASKWYGGNSVGKNTSPYGQNAKASPNIQQRNNFNMPNFMNGQGGY